MNQLKQLLYDELQIFCCARSLDLMRMHNFFPTEWNQGRVTALQMYTLGSP